MHRIILYSLNILKPRLTCSLWLWDLDTFEKGPRHRPGLPFAMSTPHPWGWMVWPSLTKDHVWVIIVGPITLDIGRKCYSLFGHVCCFGDHVPAISPWNLRWTFSTIIDPNGPGVVLEDVQYSLVYASAQNWPKLTWMLGEGRTPTIVGVATRLSWAYGWVAVVIVVTPQGCLLPRVIFILCTNDCISKLVDVNI